MPVSKTTRYQVFRRDGHVCRYCGAKPPQAVLVIDHVIPVSLGGSDDPSNLLTSCRDCNAGKGSSAPDETLVADVDERTLEYAAAIRRSADIRNQERSKWMDFYVWFDNGWNEIVGQYCRKDDNWMSSIKRLAVAGLSREAFLEFLYVAADADVPAYARFRYFCACCWNEVTEQQKLARKLIENGDV